MPRPRRLPDRDPRSTRNRVFDFICTFKAAHDGNSPSIRDIAHACHISKSTVDYHLRLLELEGRISWNTHQRRAIEVNGAVWLPPDHPLIAVAR